MGSHSNVNHQMTLWFQSLQEKHQAGPLGAFFSAKPAFSGATPPQFLGINQESSKRHPALTCHPSCGCAEPGDLCTACSWLEVAEHPSPISGGSSVAPKPALLTACASSSPTRRSRLPNTAAAPNPAQILPSPCWDPIHAAPNPACNVRSTSGAGGQRAAKTTSSGRGFL